MATKRFLYLVQVEEALPSHLSTLESADSDVRFLSWRTRSADPRGVFYPHSSWTEGRNRLYKEIEGTPYDYYVFLDDDVEMHVTGGRVANGWRAFEAFLLDYQPAVGVARYTWQLQGGGLDLTQPVQSVRFFDALTNAFHRDAVHTLLPYCDLLDRYSECYSQIVLCSLAAELYPGHLLQYNDVEVVNLQSRRVEREYLYCRADDLFLGAVRDSARYASFHRLTRGAYPSHRPFGQARRKCRRSYVMPADELDRRFDTSHALWRRRTEIAALPKTSEYFSDRPDSGRARAWQAEKALRLGPLPPPPPAHVQFRATVINAIKWSVRNWAAVAAANRARQVICDRVRLARADAQDRRQRRELIPVDRETAARWERWQRERDMVFDVPDALTALRWVGWALSRVDTARLVMMDVGGLRPDTVRGLVDAMPLRPIVSVAISAAEHPHYLHYGEFAMAQVSNGPEDPSVPRYRLSTLVRQFGLGDETLHLVAIEQQVSNLAALRSLDGGIAACMCIRIRLPLTERASVEALGFRLFARAPSDAGHQSDLIFVNVKNCSNSGMFTNSTSACGVTTTDRRRAGGIRPPLPDAAKDRRTTQGRRCGVSLRRLPLLTLGDLRIYPRDCPQPMITTCSARYDAVRCGSVGVDLFIGRLWVVLATQLFRYTNCARCTSSQPCDAQRQQIVEIAADGRYTVWGWRDAGPWLFGYGKEHDRSQYTSVKFVNRARALVRTCTSSFGRRLPMRSAPSTRSAVSIFRQYHHMNGVPIN